MKQDNRKRKRKVLLSKPDAISLSAVLSNSMHGHTLQSHFLEVLDPYLVPKQTRCY